VRGDARDFRPTIRPPRLSSWKFSDAGLELDRRLKARIYARVVNLVDRVVEVHRDPIAARRRRSRYRDVTAIAARERIVPLAAPFSSILIADLLP